MDGWTPFGLSRSFKRRAPTSFEKLVTIYACIITGVLQKFGRLVCYLLLRTGDGEEQPFWYGRTVETVTMWISDSIVPRGCWVDATR